MRYESYSPEETQALALTMAEKAKPGAVFCLTGELGGGKTVFAKGFAQGLGIVGPIPSPTFTLMHSYEQEKGLPFYHFDMYRMAAPEALEDTGCEEYFYGEGVCLIEWADRIREWIPDHACWIHLEKNREKGQNYRCISVYQRDTK